jgi:hypothetical protein
MQTLGTGARAMTKDECRANALKCRRIAKKATDRDVRRTLFDLSLQWRELADRIERLEWENTPEPALRGERPTLH